MTPRGNRRTARFSPGTRGSGLPKVEDHEALVLQHAAIVGAQMFAQSLVVIQPPECGPGEHDEASSGPPETLELLDCRRIVGWRPPVFAVTLQERDGRTGPQRRARKLALVNQDEPLVIRD